MEARSFLVIVAAMWVSWFDFGLQTTLGTLLLSILEQFGEDRSTAASVQSLFVAVNQCFGVISGLLVRRFGIPKISLIGSTILPLGFFISYFATSLLVINICVGVISAVGVSLMFVSSIAMVKHVFSGKELPMAMALQSVSVSLAGLSYPFAMNFILEEFGLNGTFLILSGYLLNNVVVSVFFIYTLKGMEKSCGKKIDNLEVNITGGKNILHVQGSRNESELDTENNAGFAPEPEPSKQTEATSTNITKGNDEFDVKNTIFSIGLSSEDNRTKSNYSTPNSKKNDFEQTKLNKNLTGTEACLDEKKRPVENEIPTGNTLTDFGNYSRSFEIEKVSSQEIIYMNDKSNVLVTDETAESIKIQKAFNNTIHEADDGEPYVIITSQPMAEQKRPKRRPFMKPLQFLSSYFHLSCAYFTILGGTGITIGCQNGYLALLMDVFRSKGYTQEQGLMSFLPLNLCGFIARLLPGLVDLRLGLNVRHDIFLASVFSLCGCLGQIIILYSTNYAMMMTGVGLTGIPMGGVISAVSIFVAEIVDEKYFPVEFGLLLTVVGLLASCFGPAYGTIRDIHGTYSPMLTISACLQFTGAVLFLCALFDKKRTKVPSRKGMTIGLLAKQLHSGFVRFLLRTVPF